VREIDEIRSKCNNSNYLPDFQLLKEEGDDNLNRQQIESFSIPKYTISLDGETLPTQPVVVVKTPAKERGKI
jgi:hypothetical protein